MTLPKPPASDIARNVLKNDLMTYVQRLDPAWQDALKGPATQAALHHLHHFLADRQADGAEIYPGDPFRALNMVPPNAVQVIILGQDPYHGPNQAQGLAFSVPDTCRCPPSLRNIFKELALEYPEQAEPQRHDLTRWAKQGVLLLNAVLTVEAHQPASHMRKGWELITDAIIQHAARAPQPKVFMLWGNYAQAKQALLPSTAIAPRQVLIANHPSPLSAQRPPRPYIGCQHFTQANAWLRQHGQTGINWLDNAVVASQQHGVYAHS